MLLIAAVDHNALPSVAELMQGVLLQVGDKREAWLRMKEPAAKASVAGVLLLQALLRRAELPLEGELKREPLGRPYLTMKGVDLSISHSNRYTVCALDTNTPALHAVGIDVEDLGGRRPTANERIVARWFGEEERRRYEQEPTEFCFLSAWTGKEALSKLTGKGLSSLLQCNTCAPPSGFTLRSFTLEGSVAAVCHRSGVQTEEPLLLTLRDL